MYGFMTAAGRRFVIIAERPRARTCKLGLARVLGACEPALY